MTIQVYANHFTAGIVMHTQNGTWIVTEAAPILGYMHGWQWAKVREYVARKSWRLSFVGKNAE